MKHSKWFFLILVLAIASVSMGATCNGDDDDDDDDDNDTGDDDTEDDDTGDDDDDTAGESPCLIMDGSNDYGLVEYPENGPFDLEEFTIECWFYIAELFGTSGNSYNLIGHTDYDDGGYGWTLGVGYQRDATRVVFFVAEYGNPDEGSWPRVLSVPLEADQWHHTAAVYDGDEMRLYLDGVLQETVVDPPAVTYNDCPLGIGTRCADLGNKLKGGLDEIRLSNTVRYTANFEPVFEFDEVDGSTVGLWHLNEGAHTLTYDSGLGNFDGTLNSGDFWGIRD